MKIKVRISWNNRGTSIELFSRRQLQASFIVPFPARPGLVLPGGTYLDFPVSSGEVEVEGFLDLERLRVDRDVSRASLRTFYHFFDLDGRPKGSRIVIYDIPSKDVVTRLRTKTFGIRIRDRDPEADDLAAVAKILQLPKQLSRSVIALVRPALDYPPSLAFQYKIDRAKTYRDLLRLFLGQVPPFLEFYRETGPSLLYRLDDPDLAGIAELAEEAYQVAVLGQLGQKGGQP